MSKRQTYPYAPGQRKKGLSSKDWAGILLVLLVVTGVAAMGFWRYTAGQSHVSYDRTSYCPASGAYAKTVLIVDLTDEISFIQEQKLKNFVRSLSDANNDNLVPQYTMLSVYLLSETDVESIPTPIVEVCNPGSGEGLSEFTGNPRLANKRFTERFLDPIDKAIGKIVHTKSAKTSPIIEAIRGISVTAFGEPPTAGYEHRLIVVSDMLQNSRGTSHYRQGQDLGKVDLSGLVADLENVSRVDIKVIGRTDTPALQGKPLVEYWRGYFRASGSNLSSAERWGE